MAAEDYFGQAGYRVSGHKSLINMAYLDDREAFFKLNIIQGSLLWGNICIFKGNNTGQRIINNLKRREKVFNSKIIFTRCLGHGQITLARKYVILL